MNYISLKYHCFKLKTHAFWIYICKSLKCDGRSNCDGHAKVGWSAPKCDGFLTLRTPKCDDILYDFHVPHAKFTYQQLSKQNTVM